MFWDEAAETTKSWKLYGASSKTQLMERDVQTS